MRVLFARGFAFVVSTFFSGTFVSVTFVAFSSLATAGPADLEIGEGSAANSRSNEDLQDFNNSPSSTNGKPQQGVIYQVEERFRPTWNSRRLTNSIGFETSPGSVMVYEFSNGTNTFYEIKLGLNKGSGSFNERTSSSTSGTVGAPPVSLNESTSYSGSKTMGSYTLGFSYNKNMNRNEWARIFWGLDFYAQYFSKESYPTGTKTITTADVTLPGTYIYNENGWGTVDVSREMLFYFGPRLGADLYLKWFPNISVGFRSSIWMTPPSKGTTKISSRNYTVPVTNGVEGVPTQNVTTGSKTEDQSTVGFSTFSSNGSTFSLFGSFVLRYLF